MSLPQLFNFVEIHEELSFDFFRHLRGSRYIKNTLNRMSTLQYLINSFSQEWTKTALLLKVHKPLR